VSRLLIESGNIKNEIPEYIIQGEIMDRTPGDNGMTYDIWGVAQPVPTNTVTIQSEGFRNTKSNLSVVIRNNVKTNRINIVGSGVLIERGVYYIARSYGQNSFGQSVPVFVYSNDMAQVPGVGNRKDKLETLQAQLKLIEETRNKYLKELQ
jgi:hypothetical protein